MMMMKLIMMIDTKTGTKQQWCTTTYSGLIIITTTSCSGPNFPAFGLNTERYGVSLRIQSKCGKMWTRITPKTDTFHAVHNTTAIDRV